MDVLNLLGQAAEIMALGMGFVFLFLGLLVLVIRVMARLAPDEEPVPQANTIPQPQTQVADDKNLVAAISAAVTQYRKKQA